MALSKIASQLSIVGALALAACGTTNPNTNPDSGNPVVDGGVDAGYDAGFDAGPQPITGLQANTWTWVPISGAYCRDGSATGIGVNLNPASNNLMIFLEGGGVCYDAVTCAGNPSSYAATDFEADFGTGGVLAGSGLFDRTDPANPAATWNMVYIPYCTGDVHAGNNPSGNVDSVGPQQFVGYVNVALDLQRVLPTFPAVTEVLLTGDSAGGFGAFVNYDQVQTAFGSVPVELFDDSGPPMSGQYVIPCQQTLSDATWGLETTVLADCGTDCPDHTDFLLPYLKHVVSTHPNRAMGLLDADQDATMRFFFGLSYEKCGEEGVQMPAATFQAGLLDIRSELASYPNFGLYTWPSTQHTSIENSEPGSSGSESLGSLDAGIGLSVWVADIIDGGVTNVGPGGDGG